MHGDFEEEILRSLRRMTRAIDLHSRRLAGDVGLTVPQLVCLRAIARDGEAMPTTLAREVALSKGTITGILDRLERAMLVVRERSASDRRVVSVRPTASGLELLARAPSPLHDRLGERLGTLPVENRQVILTVLQQVVRMMEAEDLDAAPMLASGPIDAASEDVQGFLEQA